ncbi:MAG: hypothetical protein IIC64_13755 [SAR324 cluster bacterium]|nr:hypothetical protein [SAR324 cluster bacterium]
MNASSRAMCSPRTSSNKRPSVLWPGILTQPPARLRTPSDHKAATFNSEAAPPTIPTSVNNSASVRVVYRVPAPLVAKVLAGQTAESQPVEELHHRDQPRLARQPFRQVLDPHFWG